MNIVPDALSRRPDYNLAMLSETVPKIGQDLLDLIRTNIPDDKNFGPIFARLQDPSRDEPHSAYRLENGLLYVWE
ncbi:hypothetical protein CPC16_007195, partial [Podila verticillata]